MRIVLWVGAEANQKALANKIQQRFPIEGIVAEVKTVKRSITVQKFAEKLIEKVFLGRIGKAWFHMLNYYQKLYPVFPSVPTLQVKNINDSDAFEFTRQLRPDLIIVSGTRMIKEKMLSLEPRIGILNLHTGLSPYVKGGPNCTNWCIATKQFHLIGNTVMWIDKGIDSGNILSSEFTAFTGDERLNETHIKVMEHAHDLYLRSIEYLESGKRNSKQQSDIGKGTTYFTRQWGLKEKINLLRYYRHFKTCIISGEAKRRQGEVKTIPLD
jgi:folate-dependent phosphoribosylglycinamide formyltransferase PurN